MFTLTFFSLSFCRHFTSLLHPPCAESFQWKPLTEKYGPATDKALDLISGVGISKPIFFFSKINTAFLSSLFFFFFYLLYCPTSLCFPICWAKIKNKVTLCCGLQYSGMSSKEMLRLVLVLLRTRYRLHIQVLHSLFPSRKSCHACAKFWLSAF